MTYEEAKMQIQAIPEKIWDQLSEPDREAMEMAFSALQAQEAKTQLSAEGTTSDLISRQAAIDAVEILLEQTEEDADVKTWNNAIRGAINSIKHHVSSAQPERKKGKWSTKEGELAFWDVCSECRKMVMHRAPFYNFCPNCGADMRKEDA